MVPSEKSPNFNPSQNFYSHGISYDRAKLKKVGNFYLLAWLVFEGPVTHIPAVEERIF